MSIDLTSQPWELSGWRPYAWKHARSTETSFWLEADVAPVPARLPGSVQQNLLEAGIIPDWNKGLSSRDIDMGRTPALGICHTREPCGLPRNRGMESPPV